MDEKERALYLAREVVELQRKFERTRNGKIREDLIKKQYQLDHMLSKILKPQDPQQSLFEAK